MNELPAAPERPWRLSARLLLVDPADRVLLVPVHDDEASWWDLPGGGVEAGESTAQAAVRETLEETGYAVAPADVGPVCWSGEVVFRWLGAWRWSRQIVHLARPSALADPAPVVLTADEVGTHGPAAWWTLADAVRDRLPVPPFHDVADLGDLLAGRVVTGAMVRWPPAAAP